MLQIEYRKTVDLEVLHNNPTKITDEELENLAGSIVSNPELFEARPLILSDRTGILVVIAGNRRLQAAILRGITEVPTILISGLTEEKEREIAVRDNVRNGTWDFEVFQNEWSDFAVEDWGVTFPKELEEKPKTKKGKSVVRLVIEFSNLEEYDDAREDIENLLADFPSASIKGK